MSIWNWHLCNLFGGNKRHDLEQNKFKCPVCGEIVPVGELRAHAATDKAAAGDARLLGTRERVGHGALARCRSGERMRPGATDMMLVLGNVGQVRKEAVGTNDVNGLAARQAVQRGFELAPRCVVLGTMEANRRLANALDDTEDGRPLLLADGVAENPAEQAYVIAQWKVFFRKLDRVEACHGHLT